MGAAAIGENLAYINWTVLLALAAGAFAAVVALRLRTDATRGYLAFTSACAAAFGLLALLSDLGLPSAGAGLPVHASPELDGPRRLALGAFVAIAAVATVAYWTRRRAPMLGWAGLAAAATTILLAAAAWGSGPGGALLLAVQLAVLSCALGGVFAGMVLGHWYLVTPRLGEAPLVLLSRALTLVVALQVLLFAAWIAAGVTGGAPFEALTGRWALFVWLRLVVGLAFPLAVSWAALQTARTRSMESATGLLYIDVGAIAAGTILAAGLYYGAGLLV